LGTGRDQSVTAIAARLNHGSEGSIASEGGIHSEAIPFWIDGIADRLLVQPQPASFPFPPQRFHG
jgi:hypothetical protein